MSAATWVFGYGSLIWKQGFDFDESRPASILGWERRFWQGSTDHRGRPDRPGRVVTLVEAPGAVCRGVAFRLGPEAAGAVLDHLDQRERGGYRRLATTLHLDGAGEVEGLVYLAEAGNPDFLGPAAVARIAEEVRLARGQSGPNSEYVRRLAASLRRLGADDPHVFEIDFLLRRRRNGATRG